MQSLCGRVFERAFHVNPADNASVGLVSYFILTSGLLGAEEKGLVSGLLILVKRRASCPGGTGSSGCSCLSRGKAMLSGKIGLETRNGPCSYM